MEPFSFTQRKSSVSKPPANSVNFMRRAARQDSKIQPHVTCLCVSALRLGRRIVVSARKRAAQYGIIRHRLEASGRPIGLLDTLIAAHALALDAVLVTNNTAESGGSKSVGRRDPFRSNLGP